MTTDAEQFKAVIERVARAALALFVLDQHRFSPRPCATCRAISELVGSPWGCSEIDLKAGNGTEVDTAH